MSDALEQERILVLLNKDYIQCLECKKYFSLERTKSFSFYHLSEYHYNMMCCIICTWKTTLPGTIRWKQARNIDIRKILNDLHHSYAPLYDMEWDGEYCLILDKNER